MRLLTRRLCHRLGLLIAVPAEEGDKWHERVVEYDMVLTTVKTNIWAMFIASSALRRWRSSNARWNKCDAYTKYRLPAELS